MRIVKIISYLSFNSLGNLFPSSSSILKGNIFGNVRAFMAKGFICYCGKQVMMGQDCLIYTENHCFYKTDITIDLQGYQEKKCSY